jgi:hypothetical protein
MGSTGRHGAVDERVSTKPQVGTLHAGTGPCGWRHEPGDARGGVPGLLHGIGDHACCGAGLPPRGRSRARHRKR